MKLQGCEGCSWAVGLVLRGLWIRWVGGYVGGCGTACYYAKCFVLGFLKFMGVV